MASQSNRLEEVNHGRPNPILNLIDGEYEMEPRNRYFLERFSLFKTRSNFYMVGRNESKKVWRVLKIDRSEPSELVLYEDPTEYSWCQCCNLLQRIQDGNRHVGGCKFVSTCYGIVGFIKFLGPYYMLLITKRRKLGEVCGHPIYGISNYRLIKIPHKSVRLKVKNHTNENRYKELLHTVDLRKDFYFSYSYPLMHSLQRNLCGDDTAPMSYGSNFVWNEYLTEKIRTHLRNSLWTVALVHGFFKQVELPISDHKFCLTLVARRSCLNAGPRYLKRGVNEKGEAANDVEIEQIVCQEICEGFPYKITSQVQNRSSIPLYWVQATSWSNLKPDILILNLDDDYEATKLHFEALRNRYGNRIVILNLVKSCEKKPRESVLGEAFRKAIAFINSSSAREKRLEFKSLDLDGLSKAEGTAVLFTRLDEVAEEALAQIGFLSYEVAPPVNTPQAFNMELYNDECNLESSSGHVEGMDKSEREWRTNNTVCKHHSVKLETIQNGVVRTNCIDCIDRTNVAQFMQGLVALTHQLHALGIPEPLKIDSGGEFLMYKTMDVYKAMGDALSIQYGGSAARCKIFSEKRGEWKPAIWLQEMIKTLQRYYSNAYMDIKKQNAINLFLGYHRPGADPLEMMVELLSDHSNDVEAHSHSHQNLITSSSLRSHPEQRGCFICEGMSFKTTEITRSGGYLSHPAAVRNMEVSLGPIASETGSPEASLSAGTSESDFLGNKYASALSKLQLQAFTDIEESLWFGSICHFFSDEQSDKSDLESTSSSACS